MSKIKISQELMAKCFKLENFLRISISKKLGTIIHVEHVM